MTHLRVGDVMTTAVVTVAEDAGREEIADLLVERGIGAVPVMDRDGHVVGLVSGSDLAVDNEGSEDGPATRQEKTTRRNRAGPEMVARDLMTAPAVVIGAEVGVTDAARLMDRHHINRLPVVHPDGTLVGIVTFRDLLKVYSRTDEEIRREIFDEVLARYPRTGPGLVTVAVRDGAVTLGGELTMDEMVLLAVRVISQIDGVVRVHIGWASSPTVPVALHGHVRAY